MNKIFYLLFFLLLSNFAYADGYWLELYGSGKSNETLTIKIRYGGVNDEKERYIKNGDDLNKMKNFTVTVISPSGKKITVPIQQKYDHWIGYYIPKEDGIFQVAAIDTKLPVVEREKNLQNIKPIQYLHTTYTVNKGQKYKEEMPYLYLSVKIEKDAALVHPFIDGVPVKAGTSIRIFLPNNQDIKVTTDDHGTATFPLSLKGNYLIRLDQYVDKKGVFENKPYYSERHRYDYSLEVK